MVHLALNVDCALCMVCVLECTLGFWEKQIEDKSLSLNYAPTIFMPAAVVCITARVSKHGNGSLAEDFMRCYLSVL